MIDICDFAVGLSRQLYGLTIQSEQPDHKLTETWRPIGVVKVISAFTVAVAVVERGALLVKATAVVWKYRRRRPSGARSATRRCSARRLFSARRQASRRRW